MPADARFAPILVSKLEAEFLGSARLPVLCWYFTTSSFKTSVLLV